MKGSDRFRIDGVRCLLYGEPLHVSNLSVGGFFVATPRSPMAGQVIELKLALATRPPFSVLAKVTWVNNPPDMQAPELPPGFGVKILKIELGDKVALLDFLKRADARGVARRTDTAGE